jgi:hypothetical protein
MPNVKRASHISSGQIALLDGRRLRARFAPA